MEEMHLKFFYIVHLPSHPVHTRMSISLCLWTRFVFQVQGTEFIFTYFHLVLEVEFLLSTTPMEPL